MQNKIFLITGGTSTLGQAIVRKAVAAGARVFFTYHENQKVADALENIGAEKFQLDLRSAAAIDEFSGFLKKKTDRLEVLIHNAALVRDHTIQNLTEEDWDEVLSVNLKAPYYLTKKLLSLLFRKPKRGQTQKGLLGSDPDRHHPVPAKQDEESSDSIPHNNFIASSEGAKQSPAAKIFFITSRAAVTGGFGISNYAAAKAGLIGLTKSLAQELGKKQILVNAINPGFMKSKMTKTLPETILKHHLELSPIEKYSNPEEVADFLVYLSSDAVTQVTGQVFHFESRKT